MCCVVYCCVYGPTLCINVCISVTEIVEKWFSSALFLAISFIAISNIKIVAEQRCGRVTEAKSIWII